MVSTASTVSDPGSTPTFKGGVSRVLMCVIIPTDIVISDRLHQHLKITPTYATVVSTVYTCVLSYYSKVYWWCTVQQSTVQLGMAVQCIQRT